MNFFITKEVCPKCNFGKLGATTIINNYCRSEGYTVECPIRDCGYKGFRDTITIDERYM